MQDSVLSLVFVLLLLTPTLIGALYPFEKKQRVVARSSSAGKRDKHHAQPTRGVSVEIRGRH